MSTTSASGRSVREQLVTGGLLLVERETHARLSVRSVAEAAGRSTMCVYTYYGGRSPLLAAMHDDAAAQLLSELTDADDPAAALQLWGDRHPRLLLWLLTGGDEDGLHEKAQVTARAVRDLLGADDAAERELAVTVGRLVLAPPQ